MNIHVENELRSHCIEICTNATKKTQKSTKLSPCELQMKRVDSRVIKSI